MRTFQRIVRASAAALAIAAVPVLASAATPAGAQASSSTHCAQRACDCKMRHDGSARDAQAKSASKDRTADQEFVQRVWTAP